MSYILNNTVLMDHDMWHLLAIVILLLVATRFWKKIKAMKEEREELEKEISDRHSEMVANKANLSFMDDYVPTTPVAEPKQ